MDAKLEQAWALVADVAIELRNAYPSFEYHNDLTVALVAIKKAQLAIREETF